MNSNNIGSDEVLLWLQRMSKELRSLINSDTAKIVGIKTGGVVIARHLQQLLEICLLYTSPSPRDKRQSRMPSSA